MEIELKLAVAAKDVPHLRRHALLKACKPERRKLYSIYFDTPEFDLYRRGVAFRLRRVGYHWVQTLKADARSTGALSARPEWEVQVTGNRPDLDVLPPGARVHLEGVFERLVPCFETEFQRTTWLLNRAQGSVEVALDQGEMRGAGKRVPISEVEFELKAGGSASLFEVAQTLLETLPLGLEPRSKALRAYVLAGARQAGPCKVITPHLDRDISAAEAWQRMLAASLTQFTANIPGFLEAASDPRMETDPEYVHQLRVAVRRLRAVLGFGRQVGLDAPAWRDDFKWLMGELSPARDWDVLVTETLPRVWAGLTRPEDLDALVKAADAARARANERVRQALLSRRLVAAVLAAEASLTAEVNGKVRVGAWADKVLTRRFTQFRKAGKGFKHMDAAERHRLRIAGKRLRYAAEGFASLYGGKAERFVGLFGKLQNSLGTANDIAVAHRLLAEISHDRRQARAAGLIEGFLACEAGQRSQSLRELVRAALKLKPFWKA